MKTNVKAKVKKEKVKKSDEKFLPDKIPDKKKKEYIYYSSEDRKSFRTRNKRKHKKKLLKRARKLQKTRTKKK